MAKGTARYVEKDEILLAEDFASPSSTKGAANTSASPGSSGLVTRIDASDRGGASAGGLFLPHAALGIDSFNLGIFPFATLDERSKALEIEYSDVVQDRRNPGRPIRRTLTIVGTEKFGLPTEWDDLTRIALFQLAFRQGLVSPRIVFSRYELLELRGLSRTVRNYTRLELSLDRLASTSLRFKNAFYNPEARAYATVTFPLLARAETYPETPGRGIKERHNSVILSDDIFRSLSTHRQFFMIDAKFILGCKDAITRRLITWLLMQRQNPQNLARTRNGDFTVIEDLDTLVHERIGISRSRRYVSQKLSEMEKAHKYLRENGIITDFKTTVNEKTGRDQLVYTLPPLARNGLPDIGILGSDVPCLPPAPTESAVHATMQLVEADVSAANQDELTPEQRSACEALIKFHVNRSTAAELVRSYLEEASRQIEFWPYWEAFNRDVLAGKTKGSVKKPGFLVTAILKGYAPPELWIEAQAKAEEAKRQAHANALLAIQQQELAERAEEENRRVQQFLRDLSEAENEAMDHEIRATMPATILNAPGEPETPMRSMSRARVNWVRRRLGIDPPLPGAMAAALVQSPSSRRRTPPEIQPISNDPASIREAIAAVFPVDTPNNPGGNPPVGVNR